MGFFHGTAGTSRFDVKEEIQVANGHKNESTEAKHWDGAARSSAEIAVMAMEQRGCIKQSDLIYNWIYSGGYIGEDKTIYHTKALGDESV